MLEVTDSARRRHHRRVPGRPPDDAHLSGARTATRRLLWIVTGEEKREPLAKLLDRDPSIPAGRVEFTDSLIVADEAAAGDHGRS